MLHILWTKADKHLKLWCPYCDKIMQFGIQDYYADVWCINCSFRVPPDTWPRGFNIKTGELENESAIGMLKHMRAGRGRVMGILSSLP